MQKNSAQRAPVPTESVEQQLLFRWARFYVSKYPELALLYHIPNGGSRRKSEAGRFKAEGVKAGVPDLNKITKIVCEALEGVAYKDTVQITKVSAIKAWSVYPSVWVTIEGEERKSDGHA